MPAQRRTQGEGGEKVKLCRGLFTCRLFLEEADKKILTGDFRIIIIIIEIKKSDYFDNLFFFLYIKL